MTGLVPLAIANDPALFGVLSVPGSPTCRDRGIVICSPLGHEGIGSHRPLRTLALRFAECGFPTLRFDWPASGDSADLVPASAFDRAAWMRALRSAVDALRWSTGVAEVTLLGLRIGATLGFACAASESAISEVVLLAPYADGRTYVRELRAFQALSAEAATDSAARRDFASDGIVEASGFSLTAGEAAALEDIDLDACDVSVRRLLVISSRRDRRIEALVRRLSGRVSEIGHEVMPSIASVWTGANVSAMPRTCSDAICTWLSGAAPPAIEMLQPGRLQPGRISIGSEVTEEQVVVDTPRGRMVGVISEPPPVHGVSDAWVVFLNAGKVRRIGPNRLWTTYARAWASSGLASLRFDVTGVGDSDGDRAGDETPGQDEGQSYLPHLVDDVHEALAWLAAERNARSFALVGLCSGATWGFQTALADDRVRSVSLLNPRTLLWDPAPARLDSFRDACQIARNPRMWRRALAGQRPGGRDALSGAWLSVSGRGRGTDRGWILDSIARLHQQQTSLQFIFSAEDRGLRYFERQLGPDFPATIEGLGATVDTISGPDHMFRPRWSHRVLAEALERQLVASGFPLGKRETLSDGHAG